MTPTLPVSAAHYSDCAGESHDLALLPEPPLQEQFSINVCDPGFQSQHKIDQRVAGLTVAAQQIALQGSPKGDAVPAVQRRRIGIKPPHEALCHHPHALGNADITGPHFAKRQVHVGKHGVKQLLAEVLARLTAILETTHDQRHHQRQRVKPAINRICHAMIGKKGWCTRHFHSVPVKDLGHLLLAALSPAKHISKPSGFLAFHHKFIPLRYRSGQAGSPAFPSHDYFRARRMTRGLFDAFPAARAIVASLFVPLLALTLAACESRISAHGHTIDATELDQIRPGETRLVDLQDILGLPSFEGAFGSGKVYYVSEVMIEPPGGRKRASTRTVIVISLDDGETVTNVEVRDESSGKTIAYLDEKTPTPGDNFGVADQLFSTLRRKPR
jgi:outer membrane protein assembly factor BamE (lipoprotein component of BamABCDE complex)